MPDFKDWKSVEQHLKKCINSALENEVQKAIERQELESIKRTVYDVYTPKHYVRRRSHGGMLDRNNIYGKVTDVWSNGVSELSVFNRTLPNQDYFHDSLTTSYIDEAVEYGKEYDFYNPGARRFTKDTIEQLEQNKNHEKAMQRGLKRQFIDTD